MTRALIPYQYQQPIPVVSGPLTDFNSVRAQVLRESVEVSSRAFARSNLDLTLSEALYLERQRMRKSRKFSLTGISTYSRNRADRRFWGGIQSGLVKKSSESDRTEMLDKVLAHYAEEIGGNFDPGVYKFATQVVPWGFNWLLNAASIQRFLPWGMTESLSSRLKIYGHVDHLRTLSKKGTVLLVPTHQSNIDSILIGYVIYLMGLPPFAYGAGLNLFSNPVLSFFMSNLGAYTVDRQKTSALYKEILKNYSTRILRQGVHSIFFPGGGRSRTGAIESKPKLGLLGTGLEAQLENMLRGSPHPNVYVVPMVMSYNFVFEASSLIEDYLEQVGKHRFLNTDVDAPALSKILNFFWTFFSSEADVTIQVGRPLDVFGNFVDEEGRSQGPNGTTIDPARLLTTCGELRPEPARDREYTRQLGSRLVDRYYRENVTLPSHVVASALFRALRRKYIDLDLFRFLRLSPAQRRLPIQDFIREVQLMHDDLRGRYTRDEIQLSPEILSQDLKSWVDQGLKQLGLFHSTKVVRIEDDTITSDDLPLLYYYRNRLSGYDLTMLSNVGKPKTQRGELDEKGFLA